MDDNILKGTFGESFSSLSFGNVPQTGLPEDVILNNLTGVGSLDFTVGTGGLGDVDLIYVPKPSSITLLLAGMCLLSACRYRV